MKYKTRFLILGIKGKTIDYLTTANKSIKIYSEMKKLARVLPIGYLLLTANTALAQVNLTPGRPAQGINPATPANVIITNVLSIVFVVSILLVLFFLIVGAFRWITSGGEKEAVGKARGTIVNALIGLAILALAFVIARVAGQIVGVDFGNLIIPRLDSAPGSAGTVPPPAITR